MGFDEKDKALVVNGAEAEAVRTIYREYVAIGSVPLLVRRLSELGIVSKRRTDCTGRITGGAVWSRGALYVLLRNPIYLGKVRHRGAVYDGQHAAIVEPATWQAAQELLDGNGGGPIAGKRKHARRWLDGLLFDAAGWPMKTTYALKALPSVSTGKKRYWYYVSKPDIETGIEKGERLPAQPIEEAVRTGVAAFLSDKERLVDTLTGAGAGAAETGIVIEQAVGLAEKLSDAKIDGAGPLLAPLLKRIDLALGSLRAKLDLGGLLTKQHEQLKLTASFDIALALHQNGRARPIIVRTSAGEPHRDPELIALIADAWRWRDDLLAGRAVTIEELTDRETLPKGSISRILPLAWLAPDITSAILDGRQPPNLTPARLRGLRDLPLCWREQRAVLGFPTQ